MKTRAVLGAAALSMSVAFFVSARPRVSAYAEGAPAGFSGGFNEQSCHACHFHADVDSGPGRVTITGVPDRFAAGERYPIVVTLTQAGMKLGGFQLTTRFKHDGAQAGTLAPAPGEEDRIGIDVQDDIQYANQRRNGAAIAASDTTMWSLVWTAPETASPVVFHVAANAADADDTAEGDYIHTAAADLIPDLSRAR